MFFSQANLVTDHVVPLERPWDIVVPKSVIDLPKEDYKARWRNPVTQHWLLSLAEGQNEGFAVSSGNQAKALHGFFADYDGVFTPDVIDALKRRRTPWAPAYWCLSQSRQLHLVWLFERPIAVMGNVHANDLLHVVAMKVKAVHWGVGYDLDSEKVTQVMDIGREWHEFKEGARIPAADLVLWDTALRERSLKKYSDQVVSIPFDVLVPALRDKFGDALPAGFHEGTRCRRFWDASGDNPTACLVKQEGILVFTPHDGGFKSWPSLLGNDFCEQYTARSLAPFLEDTFYVSDRDEYIRFRRNDIPPRFERRKAGVMKRDIMKEAGQSDKRGKDGGLSEVENTLWTITDRNSVEFAAPMVYRPAGRIRLLDGSWAVNTSLATVLKPAASFELPPVAEILASDAPDEYKAAPDTCAWDNPFVVSKFPHIHRFLTTLFLPTERHRVAWEKAGYPVFTTDKRKPYANLMGRQLTLLISWMAYFYYNAARMASSKHPGQALFLAGDVGRGKSFFARELLGQLMGGYSDADRFYLEGCRFNDSILTSPVHLVDDRLGSADRRLRIKFAEALKTVVANAELRYEKKFGDSRESVPWAGRVVVLCNKDPQALSVLPDLELSTRDKFMMLLCGTAQFPFGPSKEATQEWLRKELPYFARFLLGWRIPEHIRDNRFGVKAYQHPDMAQASAENGFTQEVAESLTDFCARQKLGAPEGERIAFVGTTHQLYIALTDGDPALERSLRGSHTLRQQLRIMVRAGYNLTEDLTTNPSVWEIPYTFGKKVVESDPETLTAEWNDEIEEEEAAEKATSR